MGKGRPKTPPRRASAWPERVQLEGPGQLLEAGHLSLHRAGLFAVMGDPRLGTSLEQLCWHTGKGGMDGECWSELGTGSGEPGRELESLGRCRMQRVLLTQVCGYWFLCTNQ